MGHCIGHKRGLLNKVLRLVSGDKHLRQRDHICSGLTACFPCLARKRGVAGQVTDGGIQLSHRKAEHFRHSFVLIHGNSCSRMTGIRKAAAKQCMLCVSLTVVRMQHLT